MSCSYCEARGRRRHHGTWALGDCTLAELDVWLEETLEALNWALQIEDDDEHWVAHLQLRAAELRAAGARA